MSAAGSKDMKQIMERPLELLFCKGRHFAQKCSCPGGAVDSREGGLAREHQLRGVRQDGPQHLRLSKGSKQKRQVDVNSSYVLQKSTRS